MPEGDIVYHWLSYQIQTRGNSSTDSKFHGSAWNSVACRKLWALTINDKRMKSMIYWITNSLMGDMNYNFCWLHSHRLLTGSIARSAKCRLFNLLRGRFWGFSPRRGHTLHRWGWNLARRRGTEGPLLRTKFHPHRCNDKGIGPLKLKFLLIFGQNVEYINAPQGRIPYAIFTKFAEFVPRFRMR